MLKLATHLLFLTICAVSALEITPYGYVDAKCHNSDHIDGCSDNFNSRDGWNVYAGGILPNPVTYMEGSWKVPPKPKHVGFQTIFFFNGLEDAPHGEGGTQIIQPVLQYGSSACGGGRYWALSSWYVNGGQGVSKCSDLLKVSTGDEITGIMKKYGDGSWDVVGIVNGSTNTTLHVTPSATEYWPNIVLETYGVDECSQMPDVSNTTFSGNKVECGEAVKVDWKTYTPDHDCGQKVEYNGDDILLFY